jgi:hypothetical protein
MAAMLAGLFAGCASMEDLVPEQAPQPASAPERTISEARGVPDISEYHYTGKFCSDCHEQTPSKGGPIFLKYGGDYNQLCQCHLTTGSYIHPVDIKPSHDRAIRIPPSFPLEDGKVTCLTCHDIHRQCQKRTANKVSLREGPYGRRADVCFKCHDAENYRKFDPHRQMTPEGRMMPRICVYCHTEKPDEKKARYKDVELIGDLEVLCQRCHMISGNHAGNFDHMVKPSARMLSVMKNMEEKFGIILPLDSEGKMTCATCHNPHDTGVIPPESPASKGAGSKYRHRLPERLCIECHQF